jgi:hypothetical protein
VLSATKGAQIGLMTTSTVAELESKNRDLLRVAIRLSTIIFTNAVEQRELAVRYPPAAMTPTEAMARRRELSMRYVQLREVSVQVTQLGLDCPDGDAARALEQLGAALASEAESLEALTRTPAADE